MLSFVELRSAALAVEARFLGCRIEKIAQPGPFQLVVNQEQVLLQYGQKHLIP